MDKVHFLGYKWPIFKVRVSLFNGGFHLIPRLRARPKCQFCNILAGRNKCRAYIGRPGFDIGTCCDGGVLRRNKLSDSGKLRKNKISGGGGSRRSKILNGGGLRRSKISDGGGARESKINHGGGLRRSKICESKRRIKK